MERTLHEQELQEEMMPGRKTLAMIGRLKDVHAILGNAAFLQRACTLSCHLSSSTRPSITDSISNPLSTGKGKEKERDKDFSIRASFPVTQLISLLYYRPCSLYTLQGLPYHQSIYTNDRCERSLVVLFWTPPLACQDILLARARIRRRATLPIPVESCLRRALFDKGYYT